MVGEPVAYNFYGLKSKEDKNGTLNTSILLWSRVAGGNTSSPSSYLFKMLDIIFISWLVEYAGSRIHIYALMLSDDWITIYTSHCCFLPDRW